ncbi:MAG: CidA/LrgA family protein [Oceanospirillaceae bacterium]|nr:CidA/LrgA family protein [Oceanospirillaceae bacterium]
MLVQGLLFVLLFQLFGELIVVSLGLSVPGPVLGMVMLLLLLLNRKQVPQSLRQVAEALLANLALLFVPAGVGLVLHFELLRTEWWIILLALVVSSLGAAVITATLFSLLIKRQRRSVGRDNG